MSLSFVLGRSLNVFKNKALCNVTISKTSFLKHPTVSSLSYHNVHKISQEKKIIPREAKISVKLTDAVRQFSTTKPHLSGHDHSKLWVYERYVSAGLLAIVPVGLMMPNILTDLLIAVFSVMHMHWGIEAIVIDYVRPIIFGSVIPKISVIAVYLLSIFTLVGLLNLIFNNVGLARSIRCLWNINKEQKN